MNKDNLKVILIIIIIDFIFSQLFLLDFLNKEKEQAYKDIAENRISNKEYRYGFKKNVLEYIYASDYLILTALAEASPRVIYEAMILKTLVISSNVGGVSELIEHGKTGYLYKNNNIEELLLHFNSSLNSIKNNTLMDNANKLYYNSFSNEIHQKNYKKLLKLLSSL